MLKLDQLGVGLFHVIATRNWVQWRGDDSSPVPEKDVRTGCLDTLSKGQIRQLTVN